MPVPLRQYRITGPTRSERLPQSSFYRILHTVRIECRPQYGIYAGNSVVPHHPRSVCLSVCLSVTVNHESQGPPVPPSICSSGSLSVDSSYANQYITSFYYLTGYATRRRQQKHLCYSYLLHSSMVALPYIAYNLCPLIFLKKRVNTNAITLLLLLIATTPPSSDNKASIHCSID